MPQEDKAKEKVFMKAMSNLSGVKFFEFDPKTAEYWKLKDEITKLESIRNSMKEQHEWIPNTEIDLLLNSLPPEISKLLELGMKVEQLKRYKWKGVQ